MRRTHLSGLVAVLGAASASAQNPVETLPANYRLLMENQWVRVIKVHYAPHEKVPVHDHAAGPVIYVYLADGGPVRFQHFTPRYVLAIRPPIKQGAFRMHHALIERHAVENTSDLPSDFLRVELKAVSAGSQIPDAKSEPPTLTSGENVEKVEFEDGNVRIVRSVCWQHEVCKVRDVSSAALDISFTPATLVQNDAAVTCIKLQGGQVRWIAPVAKEEYWNPGEGVSHRIRIEFKGAS